MQHPPEGRPAHRSWFVVESRRVGRTVVQRHVLYPGELNDSQRVAWQKCIAVFDEQQGQARQCALFPEDRVAECGDTPAVREQKRAAGAVRGHWPVENRNHHKRDASAWQEDRHRQRQPNAALNLALTRNVLLALIPFKQGQPLAQFFEHYHRRPHHALRLILNAHPVPCPRQPNALGSRCWAGLGSFPNAVSTPAAVPVLACFSAARPARG